MIDASGLRVAVIGGSYAGLCAALALRCKGADVTVYEKSPRPSRVGGGIVVQPDFADYLESFGYARPERVGVATTERRFLDRAGDVAHRGRDGTFYTGWDTLLGALESAFGDADLRRGVALESFEETGDGVRCRFADAEDAEFDALIGADGVGSAVRGAMSPGTQPVYAGYVGYRGLIHESELDEEQLALHRDAFVLYAYAGAHVLSYFIPGADGSTTPGERRLNWVWYLNTPGEELEGVLTDREARARRASVGPGLMREEIADGLRARAAGELPPLLARAVGQTGEPFAQGVFDLRTERMLFGRAALIGDAACLVRPHTASGTSKAASDAVALAYALAAGGVGSEAAADWERERLLASARLAQTGRAIAARSGLGA